jgi:hypothetical protein
MQHPIRHQPAGIFKAKAKKGSIGNGVLSGEPGHKLS